MAKVNIIDLKGLLETTTAKEAGQFIQRLPELWSLATVEEKRRLLLTMLDTVYGMPNKLNRLWLLNLS